MVKSIYKKFFDIDVLIKDIEKYLPDFNKKRFREAFHFAEKAHSGQLRKDEKTPYLVHPVRTVEILSKLHAEEDILIAALLHDIPEDTKYDIHEIKDLFGEKVAFLVDGITKLSKVHYQHNMPERQVESLKKLFLRSAEDPGVILIKLADRLYNMQTLEYVNAEKRLRIARETLEILVPMANLLGIQGLKSKLEDLCFKYLFPTEYKKLRTSVTGNKEKNKKLLKKFITTLNQSFEKASMPVEVIERKQSLYTIYKKLCSQGRSLDDIDDRFAIRIIVETIPQCYQALGIIHGLFTPKIGKFKDYIANPKINKYQSLHTLVFGLDGILAEIQIRTKKMHLEAMYGIAANFFYEAAEKEKISKDTRYSWVNKIVEIEKNEKTSDEFLEDLKADIFQDRISVFTPKGGQIDLPRGASAIDFAYAIHTEVGNCAVKSEINGYVMPITTPLKTGDVVNIIIDKNSTPCLSWLSFVKTNVAKIKIHSYLRKTSKDNKIKEGHKILQKEFDIAELGLIENINFKKIRPQLTANLGRNFDDFEDLFIALGEGDIKAVDIAKTIKIIVEAVNKTAKDVEQGVKVNIKVVAKNRFGLLKDISSVFYKYAVDMTYFKAWTSHKLEDSAFNVQIIVRDIENIGYIFDELEQIEDVKYVYRIPYRALYTASILTFIVGMIWIFHPFILMTIVNSKLIEPASFTSDLIIYGGLSLMFLMIVCATNLFKNYLPYLRSKMLIWGVAFGMPILVVATLLIELFYFHLHLSWLALLIELIIIYLYLAISFLNLRKILKKT